MKKTSFLFALIAGLLLFAGCSNKKTSADNWATINEEKKIVIGLDDTFVPMGFRDKESAIYKTLYGKRSSADHT